ncbi:hypothetical protein [Eudoraea chungangensis]|uniref:hypothetical protein n=1 Tax=Eudoraea chungangensis TaxID=1481905 RepID=UPI0023EB3CDC|nr:hypothetical protein [Eudoraea chungangensis]
MKKFSYKLAYLICLLLFSLSAVVAQDTAEIENGLSKTWYKAKVGNAEGGAMVPTKKNAVLDISKDGTLTIKEGEMTLDASWEYIQASRDLRVTMDFNGNMQVADLRIQELKDNKLVLLNSKALVVEEYSTSPPDPDAPAPRDAPTVVNADSNINAEEWSGLHPFNYKVIKTADGKVEKIEAIGVLILLQSGGKHILRINDDGLTTDIEVSKGSDKTSGKHFGFVTNDPEMNGEIVFKPDGSHYIYREKDQSTVEYIKE